ncbi:phosphatase PAP2 family protein [Fulvivirga ulvae]|uniref:phosphatase PAP2 family protein n=1 Tax=Fulvivirga ulvae TaxID=2904245 RepID=UPI001F41BC92|nr:phosphatase PAP2 family protein [Fulvivirga ulvae]UII35044.1 phosphatase PAP2 family protein [Fulvivirga ulvae]
MKNQSNNYLLTQTAVMLMLLPLMVFEKGAITLVINQNHSTLLDNFFRIVTYAGDGVVFAISTVLLLFVSFRQALLSAGIGIVHALSILILKRGFFSDLSRPKNFFPDDVALHFVPGVHVHGQMSFPSGHTTTAFAMAVLLILLCPRHKYLQFIFLVYAMLVGYSRMYLLQHFYIDVAFGAILGAFSSYMCWFVLNHIHLPAWTNARIRINITISKSKTGIPVTSSS